MRAAAGGGGRAHTLLGNRTAQICKIKLCVMRNERRSGACDVFPSNLVAPVLFNVCQILYEYA